MAIYKTKLQRLGDEEDAERGGALCAKAPALSLTAARTPWMQTSGQWKKETSEYFYENSFDFMEPSKSSVNSENTGTSWLRNFQ